MFIFSFEVKIPVSHKTTTHGEKETALLTLLPYSRLPIPRIPIPRRVEQMCHRSAEGQGLGVTWQCWSSGWTP